MEKTYNEKPWVEESKARGQLLKAYTEELNNARAELFCSEDPDDGGRYPEVDLLTEEQAGSMLDIIDKTLQDTRKPKGQRYVFKYLVLVILISVLCGFSGPTDIARFCMFNIATFAMYFTRIPSHDTFGRILQMVDHSKLVECLETWLAMQKHSTHEQPAPGQAPDHLESVQDGTGSVSSGTESIPDEKAPVPSGSGPPSDESGPIDSPNEVVPTNTPNEAEPSPDEGDPTPGLQGLAPDEKTTVLGELEPALDEEAPAPGDSGPAQDQTPSITDVKASGPVPESNADYDLEKMAIFHQDGKGVLAATRKSEGHPTQYVLDGCYNGKHMSVYVIKIDRKNNEQANVTNFMDHFPDKNTIMTGDAGTAYDPTIEKTLEKQWEFFFSLKGNNKRFYRGIKDELSKYSNIMDPIPQYNGSTPLFELSDVYQEFEKAHGVHCTYSVRTVLNGPEVIKKLNLDGRAITDNTCSIVIIHTKRVQKVHGKMKETNSVRLYISSIKKLSPRDALFIRRRHWQLEGMHWKLDVHLGEDRCKSRVGNSIDNGCTLRRFALAVHKLDPYFSKLPFSDFRMACLCNVPIILRRLTSGTITYKS